jgi:hypothetical protein
MRIRSGVDSDKDLNIELSETVACSPRYVALTFREEEVVQLRDVLDSYLDARRAEFKEFWEKGRRPAPALAQRVSLETLRDIFDSLAASGEEFFCVFEKQDGSTRKLSGRVIEPVKFSYSTRKSYVNVFDLDLAEQLSLAARFGKPPKASEAERKIVLQRVYSLSVNGTTFIPNGR